MKTATDKSYVTLETNQCVVCGIEFDTGSLLLDKRLKDRFDKHTCTGMGMCPEHQQLYDDGYIALVAIDEAASVTSANRSTIKPEDAFRTGMVAHIKKEAWANIFNIPVPDKGIAFVSEEVIEMLKTMQEKN